MTRYRKLLDRWNKEQGKHAAFRKLLDEPLMREALEIVQAAAVPDTAGLENVLRNRTAPDATNVLAHALTVQAGIQRAVNTILQLAEPPPKKGETLPEPYEHVNETLFDQRPQ